MKGFIRNIGAMIVGASSSMVGFPLFLQDGNFSSKNLFITIMACLIWILVVEVISLSVKNNS